MKLSLKTEYACLAVIYLALHYEKDWIKIEEIAKTQEIPKKFLEQILLTLNKAQYLRSKKGSNGGYMLAKSPDRIFIADIIRLMNGPLAPVNSVSVYFYEKTPSEKQPKLLALFKDIRDYTAKKLENVSFNDLL